MTRVRIVGCFSIAIGALETKALFSSGPLEMFLSRGVDLFFGGVAPIRGASGDQRLGILSVSIEALALKIGAARSTDLRPLIPIEAKPAHGFDDDSRALLSAPLLVGILDAEDEFSAFLAGIEIAVERRADAANMEGAGR